FFPPSSLLTPSVMAFLICASFWDCCHFASVKSEMPIFWPCSVWPFPSAPWQEAHFAFQSRSVFLSTSARLAAGRIRPAATAAAIQVVRFILDLLGLPVRNALTASSKICVSARIVHHYSSPQVLCPRPPDGREDVPWRASRIAARNFCVQCGSRCNRCVVGAPLATAGSR